ncbi:hypothetical protein [Enterobacter phage vB-EclM_KMB17]|nr:hypothetical protein [Enterobacter phage vB-EclM_KMB17]
MQIVILPSLRLGWFDSITPPPNKEVGRRSDKAVGMLIPEYEFPQR